MTLKQPFVHVNRRTLLKGALTSTLVLGGAALASCSSQVAGAANTVQYWNFFGGGDGERMIALVNKFRQEDPQAPILDTTLAWGAPFYTKLAMAAAGGRPPEIATMHLTRMPTFAQHLLDPWDLDELAKYDIGEKDFPATIWSMATRDGKLYSLPVDCHPFVLFYNTDICAKAGLLDGDGNLKAFKNAAEFLSVNQAIASQTGAQSLSYAAADGFMSWMLFYSLYRQMGGRIVLTAGEPAQIDVAKAVAACEYMLKLTDGKIASKTLDSGAAIAQFASGSSAFLLTGDWEITTAQTAKIPFSMTRFPALYGAEAIARYDCHTLVLPKRTFGESSARSGAYAFAASILHNSLDWAKGGHIPLYAPVANSPEYKALKPESNYKEAADLDGFDPISSFSGSGSVLMSQAGQYLFSMHTGEITPQACIDQLQAWMTLQLKTAVPV